MPVAPEPPERRPPEPRRERGDPPGALAPSLYRLLGEVDARWPLRDRRTDGWYRPPRIGISYGHNPDRRGRVHAYDLDSDGVNPMWIIDHIERVKSGLWYIIWDRRLWSMDRKWVPYAYHGRSPHTDHLHIEIRHTDAAWRYTGSWGVAPPAGPPVGGPAGGDTRWGEADYLGEIDASAALWLDAGERAYSYGQVIMDLRR